MFNMLRRGKSDLRLGLKCISPQAGGRCCRLRSCRRPDSHCLELGSKSSDLCCVVALGVGGEPMLAVEFFRLFRFFRVARGMATHANNRSLKAVSGGEISERSEITLGCAAFFAYFAFFAIAPRGTRELLPTGSECRWAARYAESGNSTGTPTTLAK
jgi:hypothetical protein